MDWYYNKSCRPLDIHKYSYFPQVTQCIDRLIDETNLYMEDLNHSTEEIKRHLTIVVVDLYHRWFYMEFNGGIGYSRDNNAYLLKSRYNKIKIKKNILLYVIDELQKHEFIEHKKGYKSFDYGVNSKIKATPKLIDFIKEFRVDPDMIWHSDQRELIILKDEDGKKIEYIDNEFTNKIREDLLMYIDRLSKHNITCENQQFLKIDTLSIHRVFQTDFKQYGRIYGGFWQSQVKSEERKLIKIDGSETVELDYKNQMIRILMSLENIDYGSYDAYDIQGVDRKLVKKAVICMINCDSKNDTIRAIQGAINKDKYLYSYWIKERTNIKLLLDQLEFKHQNILQYFYNSSGALCQRIDSEICSRIINTFVHSNKCLLSIHDSMICKIEDRKLLFDTMHQKFQEVLKINIQDPNTIIS